MLLVKYYKLQRAIYYGEKLPRKIKKAILGKKISQTKLRRLIGSVELIPTDDNDMVIKPFLFCPNCGCKLLFGTGNKAEYPEHWEQFYCQRCRQQVGCIDNSRFIHLLEYKDENFKVWFNK
jgi:transcription initiation factor IIE alpha subunit